MKKKYIVSFFLVLLFCLILYDYFHTKKNFYKKMEGISLEIDKGIFLRSLLTEYYFEYGQFPGSIADLDSLYFSSGSENENYTIARHNYLIDPFSKSNDYFFYKPIYDKNTKLREGYIILSRGPDGKINNSFKDTLFLDDSIHVKDYLGSKHKNIKFNYLNKYFGKKDFYLNPYYATGKELLIMNTCGCITIQKLLINIKDNICWKVVCLKCSLSDISLRNKGVTCSENGIIINISFKGQVPDNFYSDTINIIGIVRDKKENTIFMDNAFLYSPQE